MEDKLVKTNHGPMYYYFKKVTTCFGIFLVACAVVAIPISIAASIRIAENQTAEAAATSELSADQAEEDSLLSF